MNSRLEGALEWIDTINTKLTLGSGSNDDATTDLSEVMSFFQREPGSNAYVLTGFEHGIEAVEAWEPAGTDRIQHWRDLGYELPGPRLASGRVDTYLFKSQVGHPETRHGVGRVFAYGLIYKGTGARFPCVGSRFADDEVEWAVRPDEHPLEPIPGWLLGHIKAGRTQVSRGVSLKTRRKTRSRIVRWS